MADMEWGFNVHNINWVLYERAPLTITGLNEIVAMARTKAELLQIAQILRIKVGARSSYAIAKLADIQHKITE